MGTDPGLNSQRGGGSSGAVLISRGKPLQAIQRIAEINPSRLDIQVAEA